MESIAEILAKRKLLLIGDYKLGSGKPTPYYINLRKLPSYPEFKYVVDLAVSKLSSQDFDYVLGVATAGVPLASFIAAKMDKPLGYARAEKKGYGNNSLIEGEVSGKKVVVVDDVMVSGEAALIAVNEAQKAGAHISSVLVIVDREEGGSALIREKGMNLISLCSMRDIANEMIEKGLLGNKEAAIVKEYLNCNLKLK
jgi:orotate phosphoribosyltransferase